MATKQNNLFNAKKTKSYGVLVTETITKLVFVDAHDEPSAKKTAEKWCKDRRGQIVFEKRKVKSEIYGS